MAVRVVGRSLTSRQTIGGKTERIHDAWSKQVRIPKRESLRHSVISITCAEEIVVEVVGRWIEVVFHQIPAEDRMLLALLIVDPADGHRIVDIACVGIDDPAAWILGLRQ